VEGKGVMAFLLARGEKPLFPLGTRHPSGTAFPLAARHHSRPCYIIGNARLER